MYEVMMLYKNCGSTKPIPVLYVYKDLELVNPVFDDGAYEAVEQFVKDNHLEQVKYLIHCYDN